ncbi:MAG: transcription-repair coupling factor [Bowdeniella nasicola]|nr:transcription-repair coupling factor [Bowdeniella nasicola]
MKLRPLLPLLTADPGVSATLEALSERGLRTIDATPGVRPALLALLARTRRLLITTATGREADELAAALASYLPEDGIAVFPSWETLPHERLSPRADTVARRLAVLRRLAHPEDGVPGAGELRVVVAPVRALVQPIVAGLGDLEPVQLRVGDYADLEDVTARLAMSAYTRVDMVERRGEFAVRGGILDVFPPTEPHPLRLEFFGDEVEEIRSFSVADQRSIAEREYLWAPPAREILVTEAVRKRARVALADFPGASDLLEQIADGAAPEGMESLAGLLCEQMVPVVSAVPDDFLAVALDPERLERRVADLMATTEEFLSAAWTSAAAGGSAPLVLGKASFASLEDTRASALARNLGWWEITSLPSGAEDRIALRAEQTKRYRGRLDELAKDLRAWLHEGMRVVITTDGPGPAKRVSEQLGEVEVPAIYSPDLPEELTPGVVHVSLGVLPEGYTDGPARLAHLAHADLTGRRREHQAGKSSMPARRRKTVDPLALSPGDYVVHDRHGIGRFVELITRSVGVGAKKGRREYVVIEYAPSRRGGPPDRLFVPTDSLDQVTRYTGGESPSVNRLGGSDWARTKSKARKAIREIAAELVRLYAVRTSTKGHAFAPDTPWQTELEEAFPFVETPDQLATIEDVKADMEKPVPMDRLICGDVGYGKTEIAVRAAFKAVQDGAQVAVLVPTTLLVQQHYETFTERYAGFPVKVAALSRFQSDTQAAEVKAGLKSGEIDVVIGTHRLITGDVHFKNLGLLIVDEEQRFGVEHKEALKQLRTDVDVLSMSATPIPRTLEMAVTGIREMSTLATPPEERHPILTYVGRYEERQIAAAIRRELLREGQVFFVHNRVEDIDSVAARLAELVPEARIAVAHGKMNEHQLERVIVDFWNHDFDVLVCTTIVETGLDISNANTLIVDRAEHFGLSQLHQLRGRVGRGRDRAYAYFLYSPDKVLTETAYERLRTIAANTDLGAGMQVAMKDLEIRGAGNLLGGEQSGHIAGVGFDLYVRMVAEAVAAFKGEYQAVKEMKLELPVDAHVPEDYIGHERLRLEAYTKIAAAHSDADLAEVRAELIDRYGPIPLTTERLFTVATLRERARHIGLQEIVQQGQMLRIGPLQLKESQQARLKRLHPGTHIRLATRQVLVPLPKSRGLGERALDDDELLAWVRDLIALLEAIVKGTGSGPVA